MKRTHATRRHGARPPSERPPRSPGPGRRPALVTHHTDHTCRIADPTALRPGIVASAGRPGSYEFAPDFLRAEPMTRGYLARPPSPHAPNGLRGEDDRHAWWGACDVRGRTWKSPPDPARHRFTTDRAAVTCAKCLGELAERDARDAEREPGHLVANDELRQLDAWTGCCRARGCSRPAVDPARALPALDAERRQWLGMVAARVIGQARGLVAAAAVGRGGSFEEWLDELAAEVPPGLLEALQPLLRDTEIAFQVATRAASVIEGAISAARDVAGAVRSGELAIGADLPAAAAPRVVLSVREPRALTAEVLEMLGSEPARAAVAA